MFLQKAPPPIVSDKARVKSSKVVEVSCKRPVFSPSSSQFRRNKTPRARDPRFLESAGKLNLDRFTQSYNFIDDMRLTELAILKRQLRDAKDDNEKEAIKLELNRRRSEDVARRRLAVAQEVKRKALREEEEHIKETGKLSFGPKRSELKRQAAEAWKQEMHGGNEKKKAKIEVKRSKRLASRDWKRIPIRRETFHGSPTHT